MNLRPTLLSYVVIKDNNHKHFGKKGQITDYDTVDKEYIVHFDKQTVTGKIYWSKESTRVNLEQVEKIHKSELEMLA